MRDTGGKVTSCVPYLSPELAVCQFLQSLYPARLERDRQEGYQRCFVRGSHHEAEEEPQSEKETLVNGFGHSRAGVIEEASEQRQPLAAVEPRAATGKGGRRNFLRAYKGCERS